MHLNSFASILKHSALFKHGFGLQISINGGIITLRIIIISKQTNVNLVRIDYFNRLPCSQFLPVVLGLHLQKKPPRPSDMQTPLFEH